ncbi:MAG TPA: DUF4446 family protein [Candidatus Paceibacterota bacterium]
MNFTIDLTTTMLIALTVAVLILIVIVINLRSKLNKFLIGTSSSNLDESLVSIDTSIKELEKFRNEIEKYLMTVERRLKKSVQTVKTVRFNPFKGTGSGSNQSFATAFLDEENNGVVISSLYSREHVSIYSKPIKEGSSEYDLSEEEKEAIKSIK